MILTKIEKQAVVKVLMDIINSDGRVSPSEVLYLNQLKNALDISMSDIEEAAGMSVMRAVSTIRNMSQDEKKIVAVMLGEMVKADNNVTEDEVKMYFAIIGAIEVEIPNIRI